MYGQFMSCLELSIHSWNCQARQPSSVGRLLILTAHCSLRSSYRSLPAKLQSRPQIGTQKANGHSTTDLCTALCDQLREARVFISVWNQGVNVGQSLICRRFIV